MHPTKGNTILMITLLPYKTRQKLKLAKRNSSLIKYIIVLALIMVFLGVYYVGMKFQINNIEASNKNQIAFAAKKDQSRIDKEKDVQTENSLIKSSLANAKTNMSHASYLKLLLAFADSLPNGVIVKKIEFTNTTMQTPVQVQLLATSSDAISGVKEGFTRNSNIFSKVSVESITSSDSAESINQKYTTTAVLNLTIDVGALK